VFLIGIGSWWLDHLLRDCIGAHEHEFRDISILLLPLLLVMLIVDIVIVLLSEDVAETHLCNGHSAVTVVKSSRRVGSNQSCLMEPTILSVP
jgi:hypothetical protein